MLTFDKLDDVGKNGLSLGGYSLDRVLRLFWCSWERRSKLIEEFWEPNTEVLESY